MASTYLRPHWHPHQIPRADLRVVAKTERIPLDCLVVRNTLDRGLAQRLETALLRLDESPLDSERLSQGWGMGAFVPFAAESYARIEQVLEAEEKVAAQ